MKIIPINSRAFAIFIMISIGYLLVSLIQGMEAKADEPRPVAFYIPIDIGGSMPDYVTAKDVMAGAKVIIDGPCLSACTLFLRPDYGLDVCMTQRAIFGFHQPYTIDISTGKPIQTALAAVDNAITWINEFESKMPQPLAQYLASRYIPSVSTGDEQGLFFLVSSKNLDGVVPQCEEGWSSKYTLIPRPSIITASIKAQ